MVVFVAAPLSRLPEGMFVACSAGSSRCPSPQYHKRLPPIGHAAPRAHVKAEALPGWKWIGTKFVVKKQPLWKKAVQFASTNASGLLQTAVWSLLTVWFASWLRPRMIMTATASAAGGRLRQGIGKSTMLRKAFSKLWKRGWWRGRWILPIWKPIWNQTSLCSFKASRHRAAAT